MTRARCGRPRLLAAALAATALLLASCQRPGGTTVLVSGQTAYRGMGIENVRVHAVAVPSSGAAFVAETRSSYHGAFRLHLPPGRYWLQAWGTLPAAAGRTTHLAGRQSLHVPPGTQRLDQVRIQLRVAPL